MVALSCVTGWERLLIPAFVYFFRLLYPFAWVNDDRRATAAAAGGCVLLAGPMLTRIGGVERIKGDLIDDCALASAVKGAGGRLWLGLATTSRSVRPYASLDEICRWSRARRTRSWSIRRRLLAGWSRGWRCSMSCRPRHSRRGLRRGAGIIAAAGLLGWGVMALTYAPTMRLYRRPRMAALGLPLAAFCIRR